MVLFRLNELHACQTITGKRTEVGLEFEETCSLDLDSWCCRTQSNGDEQRN